MDDYIRRKTVLDAAELVISRDTSGKNAVVNAMIAWSEYIKGLPSENVQPVVRCKNCKYWDESDIHSTVNPNCRCRATVAKIYTDSEFYCAYGERKDGEQSGAD